MEEQPEDNLLHRLDVQLNQAQILKEDAKRTWYIFPWTRKKKIQQIELVLKDLMDIVEEIEERT